MESLKIYEESQKELVRVKSSTSFDSLTINLNKLDEQTKGEMIKAITKVASKRCKDIEKVILGVR